MLAGDFFIISVLQTEGNIIRAILNINRAHPIFDGHFPGQPVVPGVCMMQMVKEITETVAGYTTQISRADEMKFLAVIDPRQNNIIEAEIKYTITENREIGVEAKLFKGALTHFKFKGLLFQKD